MAPAATPALIGLIPLGESSKTTPREARVAETFGGEEERIRRGLSRAQAWVVRRDGHCGWDDAHSRKTTTRCSKYYSN